jgi:hypothetical protein
MPIILKRLLFLTGLLLTACQSTTTRDINSPFFAPPIGSILVLNTEIDIPAGDLSVIIQDGKIQPSSWALDRYKSNCDFELRDKFSGGNRIEPDSFRITRVVRETVNVMSTSTVVAGSSSGDGPPLEEYNTVMYLHSDKQRNVFRMTCRHWGDPATDAEYLSIVSIRQTLGNMFTLTLAEEK